VCGKLPFVARDGLETANFENPLYNFDTGLYDLMNKIPSKETKAVKIEPLRAKEIADKVLRTSKRFESELVKIGLLRRENQNFVLSDSTEVRIIAPFRYEELCVGELLGTGGFSSAYEIVSFHGGASTIKTANSYESTARDFLEQHAQRRVESDKKNGPSQSGTTSRYAIKHLRKSLVCDPKKFERAAIDLAHEAQLLLAMDHPHM